MKSLFEELGGTYHREGDYLIPDLVLPDEDERPIGVWGQRYERWLKQEPRGLYHSLVFTWKLHEHLVEVDERAERLFKRLTNEMTERDGVTEQLKARNQMAWVGAMNNIRARAEEIVYNEVIYAL